MESQPEIKILIYNKNFTIPAYLAGFRNGVKWDEDGFVVSDN